MDTDVSPDDFKADGYDICPGADPSAVSQTERLLKAQGLAELLPMGVLDPLKVVQRILEAQEQPNWQELIHQETQQSGQPAQKPDPKAQEMQMKMQAEAHKADLQQQQLQQKSEMDGRDLQFKQAMAQQKQQADIQFKAMELKLQAVAQQHKERADMIQNAQKLQNNQQAHNQKMVHTAQAAKQKQEIASSVQNQRSKNGGKT
jgi:hypothetical protein